MKERTSVDALASWTIALLMLLPATVPAVAAEAQAARESPPKAALPEEELDEVLVNGVRVKPVRDAQAIVNWLKLLVGRFSYSGYVQPRIEGQAANLLLVHGSADCTPFGLAPGVVCSINVSWPQAPGEGLKDIPGGMPTLNPAMVQYGLDTDHFGIRFLQVDSKGIANAGQGYLVADTLTTTAPCAEVAGDCKRITRITPRADGKFIDMQTDIEVDGRRQVRFKFLLNRLGDVPKGAISGRAP